MPDQPNTPPPGPDDPRHPRAGQPPEKPAPAKPPEDDEAIDFGRLPPLAEGSGSAIPLGQLSGPLSGASIVSWSELLQAAEAEQATPVEERLDLHNPAPVEIDAASDQDLLRQALVQEPP